MFTELEQRWLEYHSHPWTREIFPPELYHAWEESDLAGIDYRNTRPRLLNDAAYAKIKRESKMLFLYTEAIVNSYIRTNPTDYLGGMLFDRNCNLLKVYGSPYFQEWTRERGIVSKTCWDEKTIGPSAVSLGAKIREPVRMVGAENYAYFLIGGAYYYSPIILETGEFYGGIALAVPQEHASVYLRSMCVSITRGIDLQMFWFQILNDFSDKMKGYGVITLDKGGGGNHILTMSNSVFRMLQLEYKDPEYESLEQFIDPLPQNETFWNIINQKQEVKDCMLTLTSHGQENTFSISTSKFQEFKFQTDGIVIALTTAARINQIVNRYAGNVASHSFGDIIGKDESFADILKQCRYAASSESSILLLGESGVGKDLIAQAIHNGSRRRNGPFVAVNCASFSKELIASELFGYEAGAFTGAKKGGNIGKFELAHNGTLLLDEVGDMPLDVQAVLLRVLEEKSFMKVGGTKMISVNVRIIAATNRNLKERIVQGTFREDLFYRIGIVKIRIPPLRERKRDILLLANCFIDQICERFRRPRAMLREDAQQLLLQMDWPGNIRELQNLLEGIICTQDDDVIDAQRIRSYSQYETSVSSHKSEYGGSPCHKPIQEQGEEEEIRQALARNRYNKTKTAAELGISRRTLYRRLDALKMKN